MTKLIMKVFVPKLNVYSTMLPLLWLLYLLSLIATGQHSCNMQSLDPVETCYCRTDTFKNLFFLCTIVECNKLDGNICEPCKCSIYRTQKSYDIKNSLLDWDLFLVILVKIDLITILKVALSIYVVVALELNQPQIFYCTATTCSTCSILLSSIKKLWVVLLILVTMLWSKYYYLGIKIILKWKTHV